MPSQHQRHDRGAHSEERRADATEDLAGTLESVPLLDKLYERLKAISRERVILPISLLSKAMGYALNQREALYRYTTDGRLEIDNNIAENAVRQLALGRKNYSLAFHLSRLFDNVLAFHRPP